MSAVYRLGYRPDPPERRARAKSSRMLLGRSPTIPLSASLESFEAPIMDQGDTGSCTGHGTAQAVRISARAYGGAVAAFLDFVPSPNGIYLLTRALERGEATPIDRALPKLTDGGAVPDDVVRALARYGVRPMAETVGDRYSDVDPATVNDEPDLTLLEQSGRKLVTGEYRIDDRAIDASTQIQAAIAGVGHLGAPACAVGIGVFVDTAFMEWNPSRGPIDTPPNKRDPSGGGHWIALSSFDTGHGGAVILRGPNSWSASWGSSGHHEVTPRWLASAMSDCYAFAIGGVL